MKKEALVSILGTLPLLAALGSAPMGQLVVHDDAPGISSRQLYVPDDFLTIQGAIQAAMDADEILVRPGTYAENLDFLGKAITVRSTRGPAVTTIDGNQAGSVVTFANGETATSVLEGFTITNGLAEWGGGICVLSASPTIRNNVITGNRAERLGGGDAGGGGIYCEGSGSLVQGNTIAFNSVESLHCCSVKGGGVCCENATPVIDRNYISDNQAHAGHLAWGAGIHLGSCQATVTNNVVRNNVANSWGCWGGGICIEAGDQGTLANNLIVHNFGGDFNALGGGLYVGGTQGLGITGNTIACNSICDEAWGSPGVVIQGSDSIQLTDSILWGNYCGVGSYTWSGGYLYQLDISYDSSVQVSHCDIGPDGPGGIGCIHENPLFVDPANGDFRLLPTSPCIDTGDPASMSGGMDAWGNPRLLDGNLDGVMTVDMGAHEFGWVHLDITGDATPGGSVTATAAWPRGLQPVLPNGADPHVFLFVGSAPAEVLVPPLGTLFIDLASPWMSFRLGTISGSRTFVIPSNWPVGLELVLQALTLVPPYGNLSNPVFLDIE